MPTHASNFELAERREGYPALAAWMSQDPDNETFIFRKFDRLAARHLLFLQAQVMDIERRLRLFDETAYNSHDVELERSLRRHETFKEHENDPSRPENELKQLHAELHVKMKEYHETLLLQSQVADLPKPTNRALRAFENWFLGKYRADMKPVLRGEAARLFDDHQDLIALKTPADQDLISKLLQAYWPSSLRSRRKLTTNGLITYEERYVKWTVAGISTSVAALLLVGAVVSLYYISDDKGRLGALAGFTALFAISVSVLTNAKRVEIFASTAAYAAVLVVFVGSNLKDNG